MKVILNEEKQPQGVFLQLEDWEMVKQSVDPVCDLYKLMLELNQKSIFDMSPGEFATHLKPHTNKIVDEALQNGLYFSYPTDGTGEAGTFIHQYLNDKKILVEIDEQTGKEHFLKSL